MTSPYRQAERRLWGALGESPPEQRVHLKRNDVTVRIQELGSGPPVIFLHGAINCGASWASLATRLSGFRCLLLDRPGSGLSDPLGRVLDAEGLSLFGDTLVVDVLDAIGLESAHVVATSFGGYLALRSAAANPDRIHRMVQFGCPAGAVKVKLRSLVPMLPVAVLAPNERRVRALFRRIGHGASLDAGRITQEEIAWYVGVLRHTDTARNERAMGGGSFSPRWAERFGLSEEILAGIKTRTHFLWGDSDPFGDAEVAIRIVDRMACASLEVLPGVGHAPWFDLPDYCARVVERVLSDDSRS